MNLNLINILNDWLLDEFGIFAHYNEGYAVIEWCEYPLIVMKESIVGLGYGKNVPEAIDFRHKQFLPADPKFFIKLKDPVQSRIDYIRRIRKC